MTFKIKHFSGDVQRIENADGVIVGFALKMANGRWGMYDANERRLATRTWGKPKDVLAAYITLMAE